MLKIFLTGDNHIGLKYASHGNAAALVRARTEALDGMVAGANRENCDLFVVAGDLFDNTTGLSKKEMEALFRKLADFEGVVVLLPGNHDYYDENVRVWQTVEEIIQQYDRILLLKEYRPYELTVRGEGVVLYPAFCASRHSAPGENNLGWIKNTAIEPDGKFHIGIAHGAVEGETIDREGQYFLMGRRELERIPVDVWLVGHTHVPFPSSLTEDFTETEKILNAGTHVQTDVNCNTEGLCFIIEIDGDKTVCAKKFVSGTLRFYRREIAVTAGEMAEMLRREVAALADESVVDLVLTGAVTAEEYENRSAIIEDALSRFVEGSFNDYGLNRRISEELIDAEFPETSFSAGLLRSLLEEPKEAQLAYELLKSMKEGK